MEDNTFLAPLSPIQRSSSSQRLDLFKSQERNIYNKIDVHYQAGGGIGPSQPFVYTKLTDSSRAKSLTARDTQALPVGSVARDLTRMGKFTVSGTGILYIGKQILLQGSAPFDETRTYNLGSVIAATTKPLGGDRPVRHIESSGGLLNFFVSSLLSTIGFSTIKENNNQPIPGTATGPLPSYVQIQGKGRYGLMRGETAAGGRSNFDKIWAGAGTQRSNGGFLTSVLKSIISTTGLFSNSGRAADWVYRPEYKKTQNGFDNVFFEMINDKRGLLSYTGARALYSDSKVRFGHFYNDSRDPLNYTELKQKREARANAKKLQDYENSMADLGYEIDQPTKIPDEGSDLATTVKASDVVVSFPNSPQGTDYRYASPKEMSRRYDKDTKDTRGMVALYKRMFDLIDGQNTENQHPMYNKSAERYNASDVAGVSVKNNYKTIPNHKTEQPYSKSEVFKGITIDDRLFAKSAKIEKLDRFRSALKQGDADSYNKLGVLSGDRNTIPTNIKTGDGQSVDLIYFYFYDLVNKQYVPFRATLAGISDQHSPQWEEVKYMGRADSLFVYKGFTRDVNFNFKVYANSITELIPMWERVNYLVGLTRPSKYTAKAYETSNGTSQSAAQLSQIDRVDSTGKAIMQPVVIRGNRETTGAESGFIYPPMITFRIGDLYVDQPAVLGSVSITIPEDATWETLRKDNYEYVYGINGTDTINSESKSRQLPNMIDVSVQLRMLEKTQSITNGNHFGPQGGWDNL